MCNLFSVAKGQTAIARLAGTMRDTIGNLAPLSAIFPHQHAPIVRKNAPDGV